MATNSAERCIDRATERAAKGDFEGALVEYRRALFFDKKNAELHYQISNVYFSLCDFKSSIMYLEKALQLSSDSLAYNQRLAELHDLQGMCCYESSSSGGDDFSHAISSFEKAIACNPLKASYRLHLALAQIKDGTLTLAARTIQQYCQMDPLDADAAILHAKLLWRIGDAKSRVVGFRVLQEASRLNPKHPEVQFLEGVIRAAQKSSYDRASRLACTGDVESALVELSSQCTEQMDVTSLLLRSQCRRKTGDHIGALEDISLAHDKCNDKMSTRQSDDLVDRIERERNLVLNSVALAKLNCDDESEKSNAIRILEDIVRRERTRYGIASSAFLQNLGDAYLAIRSVEKALEYYSSATSEFRTSASLTSSSGAGRGTDEKEDAERKDFAADSPTRDLRTRLAVAHAMIGAKQFNKCAYEDAIQSLNRAILHDGSVARFYASRGCAKYELSDFEGARNDWHRALGIDPSNELARNRIGQFR